MVYYTAPNLVLSEEAATVVAQALNDNPSRCLAIRLPASANKTFMETQLPKLGPLGLGFLLLMPKTCMTLIYYIIVPKVQGSLGSCRIFSIHRTVVKRLLQDLCEQGWGMKSYRIVVSTASLQGACPPIWSLLEYASSPLNPKPKSCAPNPNLNSQPAQIASSWHEAKHA